MGVAVLLTFVTTYLGFLSIALNDIQLLYQFGLVASTGLLFNFVITVALVPVMLRWLGHRGSAGTARGQVQTWFQRSAVVLLQAATRHRLTVLITAAVLAVAAILAATQLRINNNLLDYLEEAARPDDGFADDLEAIVQSQPEPRAVVVDALRGLSKAMHVVGAVGLMIDPRDLGRRVGAHFSNGHQRVIGDHAAAEHRHVAGLLLLERRFDIVDGALVARNHVIPEGVDAFLGFTLLLQQAPEGGLDLGQLRCTATSCEAAKSGHMGVIGPSSAHCTAAALRASGATHEIARALRMAGIDMENACGGTASRLGKWPSPTCCSTRPGSPSSGRCAPCAATQSAGLQGPRHRDRWAGWRPTIRRCVADSAPERACRHIH